MSDERTKSGRRRLANKHAGTARMSQKEIGDLYGITLQAVQQVEYRALRKIKQAIEVYAAAEGKTVREWLYGD